jgi:hypothetical protein
MKFQLAVGLWAAKDFFRAHASVLQICITWGQNIGDNLKKLHHQIGIGHLLEHGFGLSACPINLFCIIC